LGIFKRKKEGIVKQQIINIGLQAVDEQSKRFFIGGEFQWEKSEAVVWNELEIAIGQPARHAVTINFTIAKWAVAAVLIIFVGIGSFMRLFTTKVETPAGKHLAMNLPDGSTVELNAKSVLTYHPYWWRFDRNIKFEGEGLFKVEKGKRFRVISSVATTEVLGTRFNIFSRENTYKVTCIEGSVRVFSHNGNNVILKPNDKAFVLPEGTITLLSDIETLPEISWKDYSFFFTAVPVIDVFTEIERQYGVKINAQVDGNALYTGNFNKNQNVEEILGYICPAMGLKFFRQSINSYSVIPDPK
jgi:transmembrane sensor